MQEHVTRQPGYVTITPAPTIGRHIRRRGEDVRRGAPVLRAGTRLRPQEIGLLAALGISRVPVYQRPTVGIVVTGDELQPPGTRLGPGQIYESNGALLQALVTHAGAVAAPTRRVRDQRASLISAVRRGLTRDVLLIAGGVSVGDKDFVRSAARACGVQERFWQVNIKPGMPLFFGTRGRTLVFGLPGNPVSVFVTFEEFVKPALMRLMGRLWRDAYTTPATLAADVKVSPTRRTHFIRVRSIPPPASTCRRQVISRSASSVVSGDGPFGPEAGGGTMGQNGPSTALRTVVSEPFDSGSTRPNGLAHNRSGRVLCLSKHEPLDSAFGLARGEYRAQSRYERSELNHGHTVVAPVTGQGSHQLRSLSAAHGWIRLRSDAGPWTSGTPVLVKQDTTS